QAAEKLGLAPVLDAWRQGLDHVALTSGGWAPLPKDWLNRFGPRLSMISAAREEAKGETPKALKPLLAELGAELGVAVPPAWQGLKMHLHQAATAARTAQGDTTIPLPRDLALSLRSYQEAGARWLMTLANQGLGA